MGVSSCDVIAGEGVGLHNGWCLETMDFVDFLLRCIQNTQNCVAKALVPVLNGPEYTVDTLYSCATIIPQYFVTEKLCTFANFMLIQVLCDPTCGCMFYNISPSLRRLY